MRRTIPVKLSPDEIKGLTELLFLFGNSLKNTRDLTVLCKILRSLYLRTLLHRTCN